jgi:hypothetical protein
LLYYHVNTAECRELAPTALREEFFEPIQKILSASEGYIPGHEDFTVRVHRRGRNAIFSIHRFGVNPVAACAFVADDTDEQQIWAGIIKLAPPGSGFHRLDALMPETRPWLAVALLPDHIYVREGVAWVQEFCLSMGLVLAGIEHAAK